MHSHLFLLDPPLNIRAYTCTHTQDDLTSIDRQTNNVLDENQAAASKRAKEIAESIADEGTKVNTEVHKQGEQIHKIHKEVEHVENDAKKGEREATKLAKLEWSVVVGIPLFYSWSNLGRRFK